MGKSHDFLVALLALSIPASLQAQSKLDLANSLIAAMPQQFRTESVDKAEQEMLERLNPKRLTEIAEILSVHSKCLTPVINKFSVRLLQNVALQLSEEQIKSLTAFYNGPDYIKFAEIMKKSDSGEKTTDVENRFLAKTMATASMTDFANAMQEQQKLVGNNEDFVAEVTGCSLDKKAALIKAKIVFN
jgi:hypothetical protein